MDNFIIVLTSFHSSAMEYRVEALPQETRTWDNEQDEAWILGFCSRATEPEKLPV